MTSSLFSLSSNKRLFSIPIFWLPSDPRDEEIKIKFERLLPGAEWFDDFNHLPTDLLIYFIFVFHSFIWLNYHFPTSLCQQTASTVSSLATHRHLLSHETPQPTQTFQALIYPALSKTSPISWPQTSHSCWIICGEGGLGSSPACSYRWFVRDAKTDWSILFENSVYN